MIDFAAPKRGFYVVALSLSVAAFGVIAAPASAGITAMKQAIAEAASRDKAIASFYQQRSYEPIWVGKSGKDKQRRKAFLAALKNGAAHGLPMGRYDPKTVAANLDAARTPRDLGRLEVEMSRLFLQYAQDIQTGALTPKRVTSGIERQIPRRDRTAQLTAFSKSSASGYIKNLVPKTPEYTRLMKEKLRFEKLIGKGGWGETVRASKLEPGMANNAVVQLRNRLIAMGYLKRTNTKQYDAKIQQAVAAFQADHGLPVDGIAGKGTLGELNVSAQDRLKSIIVAMERERWLNRDRGRRHVLVNIPDFTAKIVDNDRVTFQTRAVVGKNVSDQRTPEFSDTMEHMVINPTWNVPRSIATKEYLPLMQQDPSAAGHLRLVDGSGRTVSRANIDFTQFTPQNFPFDLKQPPSRRNALGLVKFMFPNRHNIYLHDTPAKNLFSRNVRAYSHGCIRLAEPFEFAHTLLAAQTRQPEQVFKAKLDTGNETVVPLERQIPVHLIYRTAFTQAKGKINFRRDIYGRDAALFKALAADGVVLRAVRG